MVSCSVTNFSFLLLKEAAKLSNIHACLLAPDHSVRVVSDVLPASDILVLTILFTYTLCSCAFPENLKNPLRCACTNTNLKVLNVNHSLNPLYCVLVVLFSTYVLIDSGVNLIIGALLN